MFRLIPPESESSRLFADYIVNNLGIRNISILYSDDDWSVGAKNDFELALNNFEITPISIQQISSSATDVKTELLKLKNTDTELVFFASYPQEAMVAFRQAQELNFEIPFYGGNSWFDSSLADFVGTSDDKFIVHHQAYDATFESNLQGNVLLCTPQAYDAIYLFRQAMLDTNSHDPELVKNSLYNLTFEGQSGHIEFDELGELVGSYYDIMGFNDSSFYVVDLVHD
ncbi:MAG: ABC transporter substrate-binding protein [bacterium]